MNYQKIYDSLIYKGKNRTTPADVYCETHHILPRSLGGRNDPENLVILTAREHFIAHLLLCKITHGNDRYKMIWAVGAMIMKKQNRQLTSYQIAVARQALSNPKSDEHKKALSVSMKGKLYATHTISRTQVTNDEVTKYVTDKDLLYYLNNGWRIGRKTYTNEETYKIIADKNKKSFILRTPDGYTIIVTGMKQFCADHNLTPSCLSRVINGELQFHLGYSCPDYDVKFKGIEPLQQKKFQIRDPLGQIVEVVGINQYCRDNNLDSGALSRVLNGKAKQHKSYTAPEHDLKYKR